jgi:hypothetical protein
MNKVARSEFPREWPKFAVDNSSAVWQTACLFGGAIGGGDSRKGEARA